MFSAHNIAIYVINWCLDRNIQITNLKLQKLLYFLQGEYSKTTGNRLIIDDFYAWQLGPVVPSVYAEYSIFSSSALPAQKQTVFISNEDACVMDAILQKYAYCSTWNLVELSHQQDPWKYQHEIFGDKALIPYKSIADYFGKGGAL
ncbi:Panacea domain-containing protein [Ruthenibacterium lactatiformans]|uniref:Panacea domain-containing protein n=1 Tax=Ruthenibacterium lactatiformans TaxID=1550024 RepID=UPI002943EA4F|nr:type II toxin-antitoxin system antitoxin SocA domain-containing protein [Ruthenibacterium lactatiformans]